MPFRRTLQPPPAYLVRAVTANFPELGPRQKLFGIGILAVVAGLKERDETATVRRVAQEVAADEANTGKMINALVARGILGKIQRLNRQGRGRVFELVFCETPLLREHFGLASPSVGAVGHREQDLPF